MSAVRPSDLGHPRAEGAAVVEFVMVGSLMMLLLAGVMQISLVLHARNVFAAAAAEGARYAASTGATPDAGIARADELTHSALSSQVASDVPCQLSTDSEDGFEVRTMTCDGTLPLLFLPFARVHLHVAAHALVEPS